jgi:hypothetical protein
MKPDTQTLDLANHVTPPALRGYVAALGWQPVTNRRTNVAVFHRPDSKLHQVLVPLDEGFTDYAEMVEEAVRRLAEYENRPLREVMERLVLAPSDLLEIRDSGPDAENGTLPLLAAANLILGARKALLALAHSVIQPQPYHPRLSRVEAEQLVNACRFGQTQRGSFKVTIVVPLNAVPTEEHLFGREMPFTRRVTTALMDTLARLSSAAERQQGEELLIPGTVPLLSANLCDALVMMAPAAERSSLTFATVWGNDGLPAPNGTSAQPVSFRGETFRLAQSLVPRLRALPRPESSWFVGFVDVLCGVPTEDHRRAGEVQVTLLQEDETLKARLNLSADDYAKADRAHMTNSPVLFEGILSRTSHGGRVEPVRSFAIVPLPVNGTQSPQ